jgi:hypothetical protein
LIRYGKVSTQLINNILYLLCTFSIDLRTLPTLSADEAIQVSYNEFCCADAGYKILRFYWSMRHVNKRCNYYFSIAEVDGRPEFVIEVEEQGHDLVEFR